MLPMSRRICSSVFSTLGAFSLFAVVMALGVPSWRPYSLNLLGHSWEALMKASGTTSFGFVLYTVAIPVVAGILTAIYFRFRLNRSWDETSRESFRSVFLFLGSVCVVVLGAYLFNVVRTVFDDHQSLVRQNETLRTEASELEAETNDNKHFLNILQAFTVYRLRLGGSNTSPMPCSLKVTSPRESDAKAVMLIQLANLGSQCPTVGPMDENSDPEVRRETEAGMVDGFIIFHARKEDRDSDELFGILGSIVPLQRSYDVPPGSPDHFIWLQFGRNVKWNSEIR